MNATPPQKIYIGKGRVVNDDPKRYPERTVLTGGWAGGEKGLWEFREAAKVSEADVASPFPFSRALLYPRRSLY